MFHSNGVVLCGCSLLACILISFAQCPPEEMMSPCTCKEKYMTICPGIEQLSILKSVFRKTVDRPMFWLELRNAALMYFPAEALNQKKSRKLVIRQSILMNVFDRVVDEDVNLQKLWLIDTRVLRGIDWKLFKNLRLQHLEIIGTHIGKLGKEFRDNVPTSLRELVLANSERAWLEDRVFETLTQVKQIEVSGGKIRTLKRSMFPKKDNYLWVLNFNNNRISNLPDDIFSDMDRLETVWMRGNRFTTISQSVFGNMLGKVDIYFDENKILCDCGIWWIVKSEKNRRLNARCDSPSEFKGKYLEQIPLKDLEYCKHI